METVNNTDIPGPQSIETYQLVHGHKPPDPKSKEEQLDSLITDFRQRLETLLPHCNTDTPEHQRESAK